MGYGRCVYCPTAADKEKEQLRRIKRWLDFTPRTRDRLRQRYLDWAKYNLENNVLKKQDV